MLHEAHAEVKGEQKRGRRARREGERSPLVARLQVERREHSIAENGFARAIGSRRGVQLQAARLIGRQRQLIDEVGDAAGAAAVDVELVVVVSLMLGVCFNCCAYVACDLMR